MPGIAKFNFSGKSATNESATVSFAAGDSVVVRVTEMSSGVRLRLKSLLNDVPAYDDITAGGSFPTAGFLTGTLLSVVADFGTYSNGTASGILEVG